MFIFYKELTLDDGFVILSSYKTNRIIDGRLVSAPSGSALWLSCKENNRSMKCWNCNIEADRFIAKHHKNDLNKPPVLELFAHTEHALVMMTRDHIIPVSLGGSDHVDNLRPACEICNNKRKNTMNKEDQEFMNKNTHLWRNK